MSFIKDILSETTDDNRCSLSIHGRLMLAMSILAVALLVSVCIKCFHTPDEDLPTSSANVRLDESVSRSGILVSIPKDFKLRSQEDIMQLEELSRLSRIKHRTAKLTGKEVPSPESFPMMESTYDEANIVPKLPNKPDTSKSSSNMSLEEELKYKGYIRYETQNGDKIDDLAQKYLGDKKRWREIYKLNHNQLVNKELMPIGIILLIPPKEKKQIQ